MRYLSAAAWALLAAIVASLVWIVLRIAMFGLSSEISPSGSGGLGAVSIGISEAFVEVGGVVFVIVFIWRLRRSRRAVARG